MAGDTPQNEELISQDRLQVERWARHDQYKARLAIIHAGVLFWHIRHFSANAFYESDTLALAVLTLWAYGTYSSPLEEADPEREMPTEADAFIPLSINLDRPADDEIVQLFVRRGSQMHALITGVGDLCGLKGPERVVLMGCKLLSRLSCWSCGKRHIALVQKLAAMYK